MNWYRRIFTRGKIYSDLTEEMRLHLEEKIEALIEGGISREAAERQAKSEFGNATLLEERSREAWQWPTIEGIWADARYAMRQLRKSPGFTFTAVLTLALGIGANAVVFSMLNALVLRPLNVPQAQELYAIEHGKDHSPHHSYLNYLDLRDRSRTSEGIIAYDISPAAMDTGENPSRIWLSLASGNYFDVLGIQPYLGRFFHGSDEHGPNSSPYIVLSYAFWHSHFQSDPGVIGRAVQLNKHPYTILGIAPPRFQGTELFLAPDLWIPLVNLEQIEGCCGMTSRRVNGLEVVARRKSGASSAELTADLNSIATSLAKTYPKEDEGLSFSLARPGLLGDTLGKPVRAFVTGLMLLTALILLAVCANLGSLFAARAADRSKEVALRLALGSSRGRILRQLLTEAVLISLVGGALGLAAAVALLHWLSAWRPVPHIPITVPVNPDARTYLVALLLALLSAVLFGFVPLRQVRRTNPYQVIKAGVTGDAGMRLFTPRNLLLTVQIAICALLVTSSLVAVRGLMRSLHSDFGFSPDNVTLVTAELNMSGYSDDQAPVMQRRMLDAVEAIPGVTEVGYSDRLPLGLSWNSSKVFSDSTTDLKESNAAADALSYRISPGYFHAAGTTLLAGRNLSWHDDKNAPQVAVVNQEFARRLFGSIDKAIGSYYKTYKGARVQVVGVVVDGKYTTLTEDPRAVAFLPFQQSSTTDTWLVVQSNRDPKQLADTLNSTLHELDAGLPLAISTWTRQLDSALFASRTATIALGVLGGIGASLAITGIFGLAAYSVSKRLREFGIRIALGAQRREILQAALGRALRLLVVGSGAGLLLGFTATKVLSSIVYQATPRDPLVLTGVILTMLLLGLLATWIPAQRALTTDPLILLREE